MMQHQGKPEGNDSDMENSQGGGSDIDEDDASSMGGASQQRAGGEVDRPHPADANEVDENESTQKGLI